MKLRPIKPIAAVAALAVAVLATPAPVNAEPRTNFAAVLASGHETGTVCRFADDSLEKAAWALAVTAAAEARGEGLLGMALTIEVMINRLCVGEKRYGGASANGVVTYPYAFSVYNRDSGVRAELLALIEDRTLTGEIAQHAEDIYPVALAMLKGWRTGLLPAGTTCRHYKTQAAKAAWATSKPHLVYRGHEFYCGVDR